MSLVGKQISDTFSSLLTIGYDNEPLGPTLTSVKDGLGNETQLFLSTNAVGMYDYLFPTSDGTSNQILSTNGSGQLFWATASNNTYTAGAGLSLTANQFSLTSPVLQALGGTGSASLFSSQLTVGTVVRPLGDILSDNKTVNDYGADPTGINDSYQAFIDMATATGGLIRVPEGRYRLSSIVSLTNLDLILIGAGMGKTQIFFDGLTGGFSMIDNQTTVNSYKSLVIKDVTIETNQTGFNAIYAAWRFIPFSHRSYATIHNVEIRTTDINSAQFWNRGIHVKNCIGGKFSGIHIVNFSGSVSGAGIEFEGFCLANYINSSTIQYVSSAILGTLGDDILVIDYDSQTTNFTPGTTITSSNGATGLIVLQMADNGTTGSIVVAPYAGTFASSNTLSSPSGGDGTITAITTGKWAGEGFYIAQLETVGCLWGIQIDNSNALKPGYGYNFENIHANNNLGGIRLINCNQGTIHGGNFYQLVSNTRGIYLQDSTQFSISGNIIVGILTATGAVGIELGTVSTIQNRQININNNTIVLIETGMSISSSSRNSIIESNLISGGNGIVNAAPVTPYDADGVTYVNNKVNGVITEQTYLGSSSINFTSSTAEVKHSLQNSGGLWELSVNSSGNFTVYDASRNRTAFGVDTDGVTTLSTTYSTSQVTPTGHITIAVDGVLYGIPATPL